MSYQNKSLVNKKYNRGRSQKLSNYKPVQYLDERPLKQQQVLDAAWGLRAISKQSLKISNDIVKSISPKVNVMA